MGLPVQISPSPGGRRHRYLLGATVAIWMGNSISSHAESVPVLTPSEISAHVTQWTVEDGLPNQIVTSLAQTPDGYLWIGSFSGLTRFDGIRFEVFNNITTPGLDGILTMELHVDKSGTLWAIGFHGEMGYFNGERFIQLRPEDGFPGADKGAVDENGRVWFRGQDSDSFFRVEEGNQLTPFNFRGMKAKQVDTFLPIAQHDQAWIISNDSREMMLVSPSKNPAVPPQLSSVEFGRFFRLANGQPAASSNKGLFMLKDDQTWEKVSSVPALTKLKNGSVLDGGISPCGTKWLASYSEGLLVETPKGKFGRLPLGDLNERFVRSVFVDREGICWVGKGDGLFRIRRTPFRNYAQESGIESPWTNSIIEAADGTIWSVSGGDTYFLNQEEDRFQKLPIPGNHQCFKLCPRTGGEILIGTAAGVIFSWNGADLTELGSVKSKILSLVEGPDGQVWAGTARGLWQYQDETFVHIPVEDSVKPHQIHDTQFDRNGVLHITAMHRGVFRQTPSGWECLSNDAVAASRNAQQLSFDEDGLLNPFQVGSEVSNRDRAVVQIGMEMGFDQWENVTFDASYFGTYGEDGYTAHGGALSAELAF